MTLFLTKLAVDAVAGSLGQELLAGSNFVTVSIALLGLATLAEATANAVDKIISSAQDNALTQDMYEALHTKSTELDLAYYENTHYHDTLHRAQQEAPTRPSRVLNNIRQLVQNSISVIAIGALLIWLHWIVVFVLIAAAIPGMLVRMAYAKKMHQWERERTWLDRRVKYFNEVLTGKKYAKEIRLLGLGPLFVDRFRKLHSRLLHGRMDVAKQKTLAELLSVAAAITVSFGLLGWLALRTTRGLLSIGDLVMFYAAVQRGQILLRQVFNRLADLYEDNLFLDNFYSFIGLQPGLKEASNPKPLIKPFKSGISFQHVSFRYPGDYKYALEDVTITIGPGEHIALVGENGAGKSTMAKLLCRLYDPTEGSITLNEIDLRQYATKDLRDAIGVMFQDHPRYDLTARENIWLGNIAASSDDEKIELAVRKAGIESLIARLPQGYDTTLGKSFERGQELSPGEWQKIALARAFLHDGDIVVLDEPSSSLDAQSEYEIFERFHQLMRDKMAVLISHRLSTVRMVDRIYVLNNGHIVEYGSHKELMKESRLYFRLFEAQAQRYR